MGESTISRNYKFSQTVDILPEEVKKSILSGEEKISHVDATSITNMDKST